MTEPTTQTPPAPPKPETKPRTPVWRKPAAPASAVAVGAVVLVGVAAATIRPWQGLGLGWALFGLVVAVPTAVLAWRAPGGPERSRLASAGWAVIALGLLGVLALRDLEELGLLCVPVAALAGSLAVAGGRSARGLALGAIAVPSLAIGGLAWFGRGVGALNPFRDREDNAPVRTAVAVLVALALLAVFGPLLAGADARFGKLLEALLPELDLAWLASRLGQAVLLGAGMVGAGYLLAAPPRADAAGAGPGKRLRRVEWALPVGGLVVLFTAFVALQLSTLFGGDEFVLRTTGLTYAEYARSGFWQLIVVAALTLLVIMTAARWARLDTRADRAWLRGLLGGLAGLTLVILASALHRMWTYQQAYGFTVTRLVVIAIELWLGVVYLMVFAAGVRPRASWLPRAVLGTGAAALLALFLAGPDGIVAERNVARWQQTGKIDTHYLSRLSADAAPALDRLPDPLRGCALGHYQRGPSDDWRDWNAARAHAAKLPPAGLRGCSPGASGTGGD
ncbi:DUF4173 domain-containing protein [Pseudonocardia eucalypti]|uniref:DUF4173 domain-containing protein n=1 Tax=Pseudonocardia eucalypti TaxID=648755 RepID=A0ABP9QFD1_9PSEU|nr:hypothetical protein [Pseudonocardia eucalypti]